MRRTLIATLAAACLLLACGGDDDTPTPVSSSDGTPAEALTPCADVLAPGRPTDQVVADVTAGPCAGPNGETTTVVLSSYACTDGSRQLYSHDGTRGVTGGTWEQGPNQLGLC